jgi:gliding motility-associated-like protein
MKKLTFLLLFFHVFLIKGQCDLAITGVDLEVGTITVEFINTENCGGDADPTGISEIQFGYQALDPNNDCAAMNQGWDFPSGYSIPGDNNHPGWMYSATTNEWPTNWTNLWDEPVDPPYYTGEVVDFPIYDPYQNDCIDVPFAFYMTCDTENNLQYWLDQGLSIQIVIWQISYGPTVYSDVGGWAQGDTPVPSGGEYEDENWQDNIFIIGPCAEQTSIVGCMDGIACNYNDLATIPDTCYYCDTPGAEEACNEYHDSDGYFAWYADLFDCVEENDTIIIIETDTVYIELPPDTVTIIETDTIFVELPPDTIYEVDTLIITVTEVDTLYIELPPDTVTITEVDTVFIELPPDTVTITETEFIFVVDTIVETEYITVIDTTYVLYTDTVYVYEFIEIDCETGLPCSETRCSETDIYIPNAFTPDNDGYNDAWEIVLDPECWTDVKTQVISRWGVVVWESNDPNNLIWDGSLQNGGFYVQNEMYTWFLQARKVGTTEIKDLRGHVTIIR